MMRGTVLLLDARRSRRLADPGRVHHLIVHEVTDLAEALERLRTTEMDVVVAVLSGHDTSAVVQALRNEADPATSIIVSANLEERERARAAGADSFLPSSASSNDLLYEIHRALILRRSSRRLPWNG
jgi:CheY-like chemotaxis protein